MCNMAYAFTPLHSVHDEQYKIDEEFDHIADNAQDEQFTIVNSTINNNDLKSGQVVIYSTHTENPIIQLQVGTSIYFIRTEFLK